MYWKRKFSLSTYKSLKIRLGEMSFFKDFINDTRGDLYPLMEKSDDCDERVEGNCYTLSKGYAKRLLCQFFPYATYEVSASITSGHAGFCFMLGDSSVSISVKNGKLIYSCGDFLAEPLLPDLAGSDYTLIVSCRPGAFDVYLKNNGKPEHLATFYEEAFRESDRHELFSSSYVYLSVSGGAVVKEALSYIDSGVSIADIRPIKYENGEILQESGRIFFSASVRMQEGSFQGVFSWIPGTAELEMTGALFYDCGDGKWRGYVAPVILYHREKKQWYVWVSSFDHKHILAYSAFEGDPRFGVNVADVKFMEQASKTSVISDFVGFKGDEDPDLFYDEENDRWLMAICRIDPQTRQYVYVFFESREPFKDYTFIGKGYDGAETGGSFVKIKNELLFICGNDFNSRSEYRIYSKDKMEIARFNHPDGGFRGWGSVIPVKAGSRTRYYWLTFDRHNGSTYNWSYGNIYCFEAT